MQSHSPQTASAALALPLGLDLPLSRSLNYPCTRESRNLSEENIEEHCQMAGGHEAGPATQEKVMAWPLYGTVHTPHSPLTFRDFMCESITTAWKMPPTIPSWLEFLNAVN